MAKTEAAAREAAKWIQDNAITYTELPAVLTLDDAIEKKNFFYDHTTYSKAPYRILKVKINIISYTIVHGMKCFSCTRKGN